MNNEKFNALLNSYANPRQIYNALLALAEAGFTRECLKEKVYATLHEALVDVWPR